MTPIRSAKSSVKWVVRACNPRAESVDFRIASAIDGIGSWPNGIDTRDTSSSRDGLTAARPERVSASMSALISRQRHLEGTRLRFPFTEAK